jgi:hypothetical protein
MTLAAFDCEFLGFKPPSSDEKRLFRREEASAVFLFMD